MIHSTLYSCDICGQAYQGQSTGGVTIWSWAGIMRARDLCPECVTRVNATIDGLAAGQQPLTESTSAATATQ